MTLYMLNKGCPPNIIKRKYAILDTHCRINSASLGRTSSFIPYAQITLSAAQPHAQMQAAVNPQKALEVKELSCE